MLDSPRGDRLLLFLHIPKTGGTSLENIICREYASGGEPAPGEKGSKVAFFTEGFCIGEQDLARRMEGMAGGLDERVSAVTGHFLFGFHQYVTRECVYLTILRDPVERVLSLYCHFSRWGNDDHGVSRRHLTLEQYVAEASCPELDNGQTRRLAGLAAAGSHCSPLDAAMTHLAAGNMLVGLTGRHQASVRRFAAALGWRAACGAPAMVNPQRLDAGQVGASVLREITRRNEMDMELLEYARTMFDGHHARSRRQDRASGPAIRARRSR